MINATELRLGNWVHWVKGISMIVDDFVRVDAKNITAIIAFCNEDFYEPIQLWPWILEKAGLKLVNKRWEKPNTIEDEFMGGNGFYIDIFEINGEENYRFFFDDSNSGVFIKTVHQLQNLYFALTGEELKIELE